MEITSDLLNGYVKELCGDIREAYQIDSEQYKHHMIKRGLRNDDGTGVMVVVGLASVIIGETIVGHRSVTLGLISAVLGSVIYRFIIALALEASIFPAYALRVVSAVIVVIALAVPVARKRAYDRGTRKKAQRDA